MKNDLKNMMSLDFYLSSIDDVAYKKIKPLIKQGGEGKIPVLSWDIYRSCYYQELDELEYEKDLKHIKRLANKFNWKNDIEAIIANNSFEALVVTDLNKKIIWLNNGFYKMTGYKPKEALHKTPAFLQGENTLAITKKSIEDKLQKQQPFKEVIINYKKDKTPYKCELHIFPLYKEKVTHFLALEKQVV